MSGRGQSSTTSRPFYELPTNIKPCSKIIQETRRQLLTTGAKTGTPWGELQQSQSQSSFSSNSTTTTSVLRSTSSFGDVLTSRLNDVPSNPYGIRPVNTQRPFTPRESDNLWGVSARKRPPSAITLSRLSLDDIDEIRPLPSSKLNYFTDTSQRPGTSKKFGFGHSLDEVDTSCGENVKQIGSTKLVITTDAKMETLSLRDIPLTRGKSLDERLTSGCITRQTNQQLPPHQPAENKSRVKSASTFSSYDQINNLDVALEYLKCFLESSEGIPKDDIIGILKRLNGKMGNREALERVRPQLLKLIFQLVERNQHDEDILFWSSFILFHCHIIGTNLTTVFKMVFKASRSKDYRAVIQEDMEYLNVFMDSFSQICPLTQTESMIYGYGTLKFICGDSAVLLHVLQLNLIPVMTLHFKILNYEAVRLTHVPDAILNGIFQLTSILRSVVGVESSLITISQCGLLEEICNSLAWTMEDIDVLSNIVRVLSVVSGDDDCCHVLSNTDSLSSALIKILQVWHSKEDIVVRLTYCLGNLLAKCEDMRVKLYNEQLSFQVIIQLIGFYMESGSQAADDILVKSIRILANWSLNGSIGAELSEENQLTIMLNTLISDSTSDHISNELLLCAMSTLNNISYYTDQTSLSSTTLQTAENLFHYLEVPSLEVRTEAMKVLGNLTRSATIRQRCSSNVGVVLMSLNEDSPELLYAAIGVLMNIIVDENVKQEFSDRKGLEILTNLMERSEDIGTNLMICQLLWNLIVSVTNIDGKEQCSMSEVFPRKEVIRLRHLLQKRLRKTQDSKGNMGDGLEEGLLQDFTSLAQRLREKLRALN